MANQTILLSITVSLALQGLSGLLHKLFSYLDLNLACDSSAAFHSASSLVRSKSRERERRKKINVNLLNEQMCGFSNNTPCTGWLATSGTLLSITDDKFFPFTREQSVVPVLINHKCHTSINSLSFSQLSQSIQLILALELRHTLSLTVGVGERFKETHRKTILSIPRLAAN